MSVAAAHAPDLRVQVAGLTLQNPIMAASGTCGYGEELHPFVDLNCLGAVVVKGTLAQTHQGQSWPAPGGDNGWHAELCGVAQHWH